MLRAVALPIRKACFASVSSGLDTATRLRAIGAWVVRTPGVLQRAGNPEVGTAKNKKVPYFRGFFVYLAETEG